MAKGLQQLFRLSSSLLVLGSHAKMSYFKALFSEPSCIKGPRYRLLRLRIKLVVIIIYWGPQHTDCAIHFIDTIAGSSYHFHLLGRRWGLERFQTFSKDHLLERLGISSSSFVSHQNASPPPQLCSPSWSQQELNRSERVRISKR